MELGLLEKYRAVNVINLDGRRYINTTDKIYDAIILDLPDPDTFQMNRFFTAEFFSTVHKRLTGKGIFCIGMVYYPNYLSEVMRKKLSSIYNTARLLFKNIKVIPGEKAYFICSDGTLTMDIPELLEEKLVSTSYISGYFRGNVTEDRIEMIYEALDPDEPVNTDFQPKVMSLVFQEWFLKHGTSPKPFLIGLGILTILYLLLMRKEEYVLFTTGFAIMGAEMLVVFAFQVLYGYVYLKIGAIVTAFLAGLLPGAAAGKLWGRQKLRKLLVADVLLVAGLMGFYAWLRFHGAPIHSVWFLVYGFVISFFCGFQFPAATEIIGEDKSPAAGCLAADMTGAAIGTLVIGAILIPLMGLRAATIALILIKVSSNVVALFTGSEGGDI
jgi:spermidine synthase